MDTVTYRGFFTTKRDAKKEGKAVLSKEEDHKNNPDCQNCPYFINKLVCPFHRKKTAEGHESYNSGTSQRKNE